MERIPGDIDEEIFSDRAEDGPFGVEFRQIPIRLQLWHLERLPPFPQQPANSFYFLLRLFPLCEQHAEGKRRKYQRTNKILPPFCSSSGEAFLKGET